VQSEVLVHFGDCRKARSSCILGNRCNNLGERFGL